MKLSTSTIFASALAGLVLAAPAFAQAPGGGGGFGGGGGGGFQRPTFGTVSAVDTTANTITITGRNNDTQTIKLGDGAQITTETTVTVNDLKVGDQVQIQGVPTGITASTVTVGTPPQGMGGGFGGFGRGGGGGNNGNGNNGAAPQAQGFATATGTIQTLPTAADAHLAISLGPDATLYVKMADNAKVSRYSTETLGDIKAGDRILATGTTGADGTVTATSIGVNMQMGGGGFGGRGGFGGGRGGRGGRRGGGQGGGNNAPAGQ